MPQVKLLYFGQLAQITGKSSEEINAQCIADLRAAVTEKYPGLKSSVFSVSVNRVIRKENHELNEADEVAFLPPFSGG